MGTEDLLPQGEKIRRAVRWISEIIKEHPEKRRRDIVLEAERRFDLSPKDCEFLNRHLAETGQNQCGSGQTNT